MVEIGRGLDAVGVGRIAGGGLAAFGAACLAELVWRGLPVWDRDGPGPAFFPGFLSVCLLVLGVLMALDLDRNTQLVAADAVEEETASPGATLRFCLLLVALIFSFPYLGGVVAFSAFVLLEMLWVERARLRDAIITAAIAFCAIWLLFIHVLAVPLPAGLLGFIR